MGVPISACSDFEEEEEERSTYDMGVPASS